MVEKILYIFRNETLRNGSFFTFFSFVNKGMNFVLLILLARYITPTEYGFWSLFSIVVMFIGYFIAMTTEGYITISFFQEGMLGVKKSFSCILATTAFVGTVICVLIYSLQPLLATSLDFPWSTLYLALGISFFTVYSNICLNFFRIRKKVLYYGLFSCGNAILILGLSIFFVKFMHMGWYGCVLAQLICVCLFGTIGLVHFFQMKCISFPNKSHLKIMLLWGIPLIPHLSTQFIRLGCDRYIINHFFSVEAVGLFSFAYTISMAISTIGYGFNEANSINIYETLGNENLPPKEKIHILSGQMKSMFLVYVCGLIVTVLLSTMLVPIFLPKYTSALTYFFLLAMFAFFQCMYFLYTNFLFFYKQTKMLMCITFSFAVVHFILSILLTRYSLYITCCIYCFTQLGVVFFVRKNALKIIKKNLN